MTTKQFFSLIAIVSCVCSQAQTDKEDTTGVIKNLGVINDMQTPDATKKEVIPIKSDTKAAEKPGTNPMLNGYYVLYNKNRQKTKDGTFKDNRLMDGKNYIYDEKGVLMRIELYKDFKYVGDTTDK